MNQAADADVIPSDMDRIHLEGTASECDRYSWQTAVATAERRSTKAYAESGNRCRHRICFAISIRYLERYMAILHALDEALRFLPNYKELNNRSTILKPMSRHVRTSDETILILLSHRVKHQ